MMSLSEILDREFAKLTKEQRGSSTDYSKQEAQADFLGVTPGWLSRLRNGKARLSVELSRQFANRLCDDPDARKNLLHELQVAAGILDDDTPLRFPRNYDSADERAM